MKPFHKNPRKITDKQRSDLAGWMEQLGDLSGIVHDLNSDEIIGGNQREFVFKLSGYKIELTETYPEPDAQGTVGLGYIVWKGFKFNYRQVRWSPDWCEAGNIIANKAGGSWDFDVLHKQWDQDILLRSGWDRAELGIYDPTDVRQEWEGMPEFNQQDMMPEQSVLIHFQTREDAQEFAKLLGQTITDKTKFLWFPKKERLDMKSMEYATQNKA